LLKALHWSHSPERKQVQGPFSGLKHLNPEKKKAKSQASEFAILIHFVNSIKNEAQK
jgi:hypothetical protein